MSKGKRTHTTDENKEHKQQRTIDENWLRSLYDPTLISDDELNDYYNEFKYVGFNRDEVLIQLQETIPDIKICAQAVIVCALRGPKKASEIKLSNGRSLREMGIQASGGKGTNRITCGRITASTADLAAFYLKRLNIPKRISSSSCPAYLQFPSAGSIIMSDNLREAHREFSMEFSKRIKGEFNSSIYDQMHQNAYLNASLRLFDL
jgi:hypothetical protein